MQLTSVILSLAAATAITAAPSNQPSWQQGGWPGLSNWGPGSCLSDYQAQALVNTFTKVEETNGNDTATFNALIESVANADDQEISDSINLFTGTPYGQVTEPNLATIEAGHAHGGPGVYEIQTLNIWHSCNSITWRWRFTLFPGAIPVQGMNVFVLGSNGKIDQTYIEFNSVAWAQDLGYTVTAPPGFPPPQGA